MSIVREGCDEVIRELISVAMHGIPSISSSTRLSGFYMNNVEVVAHCQQTTIINKITDSCLCNQNSCVKFHRTVRRA